ncbi:Uncharacterized protein DAT39_021511 [Clarias magur]|uniref:Uncharacterized protein n=1 Tax=Clarias magur TaxID=1594786 RepID=A0A8J4TPI0_CLAMG|nr:Uncharacterized protein DAT39_021511 [Clarias magur]
MTDATCNHRVIAQRRCRPTTPSLLIRRIKAPLCSFLPPESTEVFLQRRRVPSRAPSPPLTSSPLCAEICVILVRNPAAAVAVPECSAGL